MQLLDHGTARKAGDPRHLRQRQRHHRQDQELRAPPPQPPAGSQPR